MVFVRHAAIALLVSIMVSPFIMVQRVAADGPLPRAKPEDVGFSPERLASIGAVLKQDIAEGRIPGAVIAIARRGKLVMLEAWGWRDKEAKIP